MTKKLLSEPYKERIDPISQTEGVAFTITMLIVKIFTKNLKKL